MANSDLQKLASRLMGKDDSGEGAFNTMLDRYWNTAQSARKELDWKWFNYDLWVSGNHYAKWDKNTQQITSSPRSDGRPKVVINKVYTTLRSVRSYALQNRPKADVTPTNLTQDNLDQAIQLNKFIDYVHDRLHLQQSLRATLWHALKYSVGWWQILWDEDAEEGKGEIMVNVVDPYDLYIDPVARIPKEARFMILAVRRNLEDLKDDPKYKDVDWSGIQGDRFLAASPLKGRLLSYERGDTVIQGADKKNATAIVKEFWYRDSAEEEIELAEGEMDPETGEALEKKKKIKRTKTKIMLVTKIADKIIRGPIDTGLERFPFFRLSSDIEPLSMYGQGWVKHLVPVNRLLERLESSAAEYNDVVNKGRYSIAKGAGIRNVNNEHGQFVEHKPGAMYTPQPIQVPPLSPILMEQIMNANRYIEDIGAMHDASLGRVPQGVKSGIGVETLMEGDSNNLSELIENTEEFLEDCYEYILYLASQKYQFARSVITATTTGEKEFLSVIGEAASTAQDMQGQDGTAVISPKNTVDVKITSWLAHTNEGRQKAITELAQIMASQGTPLPPDVILRAFEVGNIADIVKQIEDGLQKQKEEQMQQQQQQQQMQQQGQMQMQQHQAGIQAQQQQAQASQQQAQGPQPAGAQQAIAFIRAIINGQKPELPQSVGPDFINYLDKFIQSPEAQQMGGELLSVLQQDRDQAVLSMQGGTTNQVKQQ